MKKNLTFEPEPFLEVPDNFETLDSQEAEFDPNGESEAEDEESWKEEDEAHWDASEADAFGESSETDGSGFLEMESFDEVDSETLFTSEFDDEVSSAGSGGNVALSGGKQVVARVPLLKSHRGTGPDLIVSWNDMTTRPDTVDVVVHLHGFALCPPKPTSPWQRIAPSGIDWSDPGGSDRASSRGRPTLGLIPKGHFDGNRTSFPALVTKTGLRDLVNFGLNGLSARFSLPGLKLGRLIVTAHSGGGKALLKILQHNNPHEVHVFDALYQDPGPLIEWAKARIAKDRAAIDAAAESAERYMPARGGALRVLYLPCNPRSQNTQTNSLKVHAALSASIPSGSALRAWYRVERTSRHCDIPHRYGWRLLARANADLPEVSPPPKRKPICPKSAARKEISDEFETSDFYESPFDPASESESEGPDVWAGSTDQVAFRDRVLVAHLARSKKRGTPKRNLARGELGIVDGTKIYMGKVAAAAAGRLLAAANLDLKRAQEAKDVDALRTIRLTASSGYRDSDHQQELWLKYFPGYYDRTRSAREKKSGGPHSAQAVSYMLAPTSSGGFGLPGRIAAPGYSNHQGGIAIDFQQNRRKGHEIANKSQDSYRRKWKKSWFFGWLRDHAARFGFKPIRTEEWHWEYKPSAVTAGELPWMEEDEAHWDASEADTFGENSEAEATDICKAETFAEIDSDTVLASEFDEEVPSKGSPDRWDVPADVRAIGESQSVRYDDSLPWFDDKRNCTTHFTPGAAELQRHIQANFPGVTKIGGLSCRKNSASPNKVSIHGVGRALDIYIPTVGGRANSPVGDPIVNWLVQNAPAIGIQYIIWNRVRWSGYARAGKSHFAPYTGPCPHIKHIHVELNLAGSQRKTPWFAGKNGTKPTSSQQGSANPAAELVRFAQRVLNAAEGERLSDDGDLGRLTRGALERFRKKYNLGVGGVLDSKTELALAQRALEEIAQQSRFAQPGVLDAETEQTLKTFKSARRLGFDAKLDAATRVALTDAMARRASAPMPDFTPSGLPKPGAGITAPGSQGSATAFRSSSTGTSCKDDRCTSAYIRWMQTSLNPILGIQLELTGKLDSPTIRAIKTFKKSLQLKTKEYYVGPIIERTLIAAGAAPPPPLAKAPCGASLVSELLPLLKKYRGDIPIEFLLGWIEVESGRRLGSLTTICERGYFQLHPEESIKLRRDHDLMGTNAEYSVDGGIALVNDYRQRIDRLSQTFGITRGSNVYWRLVKLCHWIPSAAQKILTSMRRQGIAFTDWKSISTFAKEHASSLKKIIKRDPIDGIRSVDKTFKAVEDWRKKLSLSSP